MRSRSALLLALWIAACLAASPALAAGRVELQLVGDQQAGAAMGFQQWLETLRRADVKSTMRVAAGNVRLGIEVRGTEKSPVYIVTGMINSRDELVLPGARFKRSDVGRLKEWIDDLAKNGPVERREAKSAFGLTEKQFEQVKEDLAKPVPFSTKEMTRAEAIEKIGGRLANPVRIEGELTGGEEQIGEELSGLSSGTVLASILRPAGYCMAPQEADGKVTYAISQVSLEKIAREVWPIGWKPEKPPGAVLPSLLESRNVNVQGITVDKFLEAVSQHIKVPILIDQNALARHGIDPQKAIVSHPSARTTYSIALRGILSKERMKFELRVDEAGKPFLWVTSVKPV